MRALDLFCCQGGATRGLQRAGFYVIGIDIRPQPRYCGDSFVQADALMLPVDLDTFDFIWASPPCQHYSRALNGWGEHYRARHPDLLGRARVLLAATGIPFVIENVPGAPLQPDVILSGGMFGLPIVRERWFEVHGFRPPFRLAQHFIGRTTSNGGLACVVGHGANRGFYKGKWSEMPPELRHRLSTRNSVAGWREAMEMPWASRDGIREAVPPAYSEFIGRAFLAQQRLEARAA